MDVIVLAASGPTGRQLAGRALDRGHRVMALARTPASIDDLRVRGAQVEAFDVTAPGAAATLRALARGADALVSGLGTTKGGQPGTLTTGARVVSGDGAALVVPRTVWLSALGSGGSRVAAGRVWSSAMKLLLRAELTDKESADELVLAAGGISVHAPVLGGGEATGGFGAVAAAQHRGGVFPGTISRADLAAVVLDVAAGSGDAGRVLVASRSADRTRPQAPVTRP